jgi:hypothetical protein
MPERTASEPSAAQLLWTSPPRQGKSGPAGAAKFVICDETIEPCFEEGKTELGMDHYAGRKYAGWQHHMVLTMLAHFFLWHLQGRLGEKSTSPHGVAAPPVMRSRVAPAYVYD